MDDFDKKQILDVTLTLTNEKRLKWMILKQKTNPRCNGNF